MDCEALGLRVIPAGLPEDTTRLLIANNPLSSISNASSRSTVLSSLTMLAYLDLSNAEIAVLPANLLDNLSMLKTLLIANNKLTSLTGLSLQGMHALEVLDASRNQLTEIPAGYVAGSALVSLLLSGNAITTLRDDSCGSALHLQSIDLSNNAITVINLHAFSGSTNLHTLDLSGQGLPTAARSPSPPSFAGLRSLIAIKWMSAECPAGFGSGFLNSDSHICLRCPRGTFKPDGEGSLLMCMPCPAGASDHDFDPVTKCMACGPGQYTAVGETGPCRNHTCDFGEHDHDSSASTPCRKCHVGTYSGRGGVECRRCPAGTTDADYNPATPCQVCDSPQQAPSSSIGPCTVNSNFGSMQEASVGSTAAVGSALGAVLIAGCIIGVAYYCHTRAQRRLSREKVTRLLQRVKEEIDRLGLLSSNDATKKIDDLQTPRSHFHVNNDRSGTLGHGEFGVVVMGMLMKPGSNPSCGTKVAVKRLRTQVDAEDQQAFLLEVHLSAVLSHPRIVRVLALCTTEVPFMAALELMDGGDLRSFLRRAVPKPATLLLVNACWQIATALVYLKERGVIHRDVAARNVLVHNNLEVVKLADFGMSRILDRRSKKYYHKV